MNAFILAAGLGTRLRPWTRTIPKPCLPVLNRPLILRIMDTLKRSGVEAFGVNLHHLPGAIRRCVSGSVHGERTRFVHEPEILNSGGGIVNAWERLFPGEDLLLTVNGDCIYDAFPLEVMVRRMEEAQAEVLLLTVAHKSGTTPLKGNPQGLFVKIEGGEDARTYIGAQLVSRKALKALPRGPISLFSEGYLPLVEAGKIRILLHPYEGFWAEAGTEGDLIASQFALLKAFGRRALPPKTLWEREKTIVIPRGTVIPPDVTLDHVVIGRGSQIEGPATLDHCLLLPGSSVPPGIHENRIFGS